MTYGLSQKFPVKVELRMLIRNRCAVSRTILSDLHNRLDMCF